MSFGSLLSNVKRNATNYAAGVFQNKLTKELNKLTKKIPNDYLGILGTLLGASDVDPMQTLMFSVQVSDLALQDYMIQSVNLPMFRVEYREQVQQGTPAYYPKKLVFNSDLTIRFNEDREGTILMYYYSKVANMFNMGATVSSGISESGVPVEHVKRAWNYAESDKIDITIDILSGGGGGAANNAANVLGQITGLSGASSAAVLRIEYLRCSISDISGFDFDAAGGQFVQPSLSFKVEEMKITDPRGGGSSTNILDMFGNRALSTVKGKLKSYIGY